MNNINETILKNFNANIAYIERSHPKLFEKLSALDNAVANGHYQERYELVYEQEGFDVLEKATGSYLYNKQATKHTQTSLKSLDYSTLNNCFEGFVRREFTQEDVALFLRLAEEKPLDSYASYVADIIYETKKEAVSELQSIDKYIFFGTGLGQHIDAIDKKISAEVYLIVEDDLELFRLSLFCTNYAELASHATLFFSVFDDDTEFSHTAELFLKECYYYNHYIKYFQLASHSEEKADRFYLAISSQSDLKFLFHDYLKINISPIAHLAHNNILLKTLNFNTAPFHNTPFLLLTSGPSLQKNLPFLKKNKNRFIIVAVSSALKFLETHDITPNIVVHLDPFEPSVRSYKRLSDLSFVQESLHFLAASSPDKLFEILNKKNIFLYEAGSNYKKDAFNVSAPCIGSLSYMLLLAAKAKNIYLLGLDLAVDSDTGVDHIATHQDTKQLKLENALATKDTLSYKEDLFETQGNFRKTVFTTPHFYSSVDIINRYFPVLKKEFQKVYNLSDGVRINTADPLNINRIKAPQKLPTDFQKQLKTFLLKHTASHLNQEDFEALQAKLHHAQELSDELQNYQITQLDAKQYVQAIYNAVVKEDALYHFELARVLDSYLYYILGYVYNYLNNTADTKESFQTIDTLLRRQMLKLIGYYIEALQKVINKGDTDA